MFAGKSRRIFQNAGGKVNAGKVIKCGSYGNLATMLLDKITFDTVTIIFCLISFYFMVSVDYLFIG
jgi:hypothetical protein